MTIAGRFRPSIALTVALAVVVALTGLPAVAATDSGAATLSGRVLAADGVTPRAGVDVSLVDPTDGSIVAHGTSDETGAFRIADAPTGSWGLVAGTEAGAFVAGEAIPLQTGDNRPVSLTLSDTSPSLAPGQAAAANQGLPTWAKWTVAGTIIVAALFVISESSDDVEEPASPF